MQVNQLLEQVRLEVRRHGATGIHGIGRKFRICDDDNSGHIDDQEFEKAMRELGFNFNPNWSLCSTPLMTMGMALNYE